MTSDFGKAEVAFSMALSEALIDGRVAGANSTSLVTGLSKYGIGRVGKRTLRARMAGCFLGMSSRIRRIPWHGCLQNLEIARLV